MAETVAARRRNRVPKVIAWTALIVLGAGAGFLTFMAHAVACMAQMYVGAGGDCPTTLGYAAAYVLAAAAFVSGIVGLVLTVRRS